MTRELVGLFGKRGFAGPMAGGAGTAIAVVEQAVCTLDGTDATLMVRLHSGSFPGTSTVTVKVKASSPSEDAPDVTFVSPAVLASVTFDSAVTAPALRTCGVAGGLPSHVQVTVESTRDGAGNAASAELSADLVLGQGGGLARRELRPLSWNYAGTAAIFLWWVDFGNTTAATPDARATLAMPFAGMIERVVIYTDTGGGVTTLSFHKNGSGTATVTVSGTLTAAGVTTFDFGVTARFAAGDTIHLRLDATVAVGNCAATAVLRYTELA